MATRARYGLSAAAVAAHVVLTLMLAYVSVCRGSPGAECSEPAVVDYDLAATFVDSLAPVYPYMAKRAQLEGTVVLEVTVLSSGQACNVNVLKSPNPILSQAAKLAATGSAYAPAQRGGRPVASVFRVAYAFRLSDPIPERADWPEAPMSRPLVSERGDTVTAATPDGVRYLRIDFEGVVIRGDMPLALYRDLVSRVNARLRGADTVLQVTNYLSLPRNWDPEYKWAWATRGDILIEYGVAAEAGDNPILRGGKYFIARDGAFVEGDTAMLYR